MGFEVLKLTVTVNVYWDMTPFSLADRYNSYVGKSRSGFLFPESLECVYQGTRRNIPEDNLSYYFGVYVSVYVCMLPTCVLTLSLISAKLYLDVKDVCSCVVFVWS